MGGSSHFNESSLVRAARYYLPLFEYTTFLYENEVCMLERVDVEKEQLGQHLDQGKRPTTRSVGSQTDVSHMPEGRRPPRQPRLNPSRGSHYIRVDGVVVHSV